VRGAGKSATAILIPELARRRWRTNLPINHTKPSLAVEGGGKGDGFATISEKKEKKV